MAIVSGEHTGRQRRAIDMESFVSAEGDQSLLAPDEPAPLRIVNDSGTAKTLLLCDHASRRIPRSLDDLGLDDLALHRHVACDIGAGDVTRKLSEILDAPAILAEYSRLVVDCNRHLNDPTAFRAVSDGEFVPGNHDLDAAAKKLRAQAIFYPYHKAIGERLGEFRERSIAPAVIAIHSFTPIFNRTSRPWQIGVLWDTDDRIPKPLMEKLGRIPGTVVGDNEPYSGKLPADYTIDHHAEPAGLPHVSIEIRQDLIRTPAGVDRWSSILGRALGEILACDQLYKTIDSRAD
jgi:predicted N-formylglutamate amidohydrolase